MVYVEGVLSIWSQSFVYSWFSVFRYIQYSVFWFCVIYCSGYFCYIRIKLGICYLEDVVVFSIKIIY